MSKPAILDTRTKTLHIGSSYREILKGLSLSERIYLRRVGTRGQVDEDHTWKAELYQGDQDAAAKKLEIWILVTLVAVITAGLFLMDWLLEW